MMAGIDERLHVPRRKTPRSDVPALAVAIANGQTTIYPRAHAGRLEPDRHRAGERLRPAPRRPVPVPPRRPRELRAADGEPPAPPERRLLLRRATAPGVARGAGRPARPAPRRRAGSTRRTTAWRSPGRSTRARRWLANALCGNAPGTALIESHAHGADAAGAADVVVGAAGRGLRLYVDGEPVGQSRPLVRTGQRVALRPDRPRRARLPRASRAGSRPSRSSARRASTGSA